MFTYYNYNLYLHHPVFHIYIPPSDTKDTVTTCLEEGAWRAVNVTCVPVEVPSPPLAGLRNGEGRALSFDLAPLPPGDGQGTQGLVVALAVVAGLLTAAMLVVGTLLARRHLSSTSGSLRSLVKASHSKESAMNGGIVGPQHSSFSPSGSNLTLGPSEAEDPPNTDNLRSSLYQQNLLNLPLQPHPQMTSITESELDDDPNYAHIVGGNEPPYERVRNRSEHSYETLRKKSIASESDGESTREDQLDKDSDGYESVSKEREPSYEAVEMSNHDYETLKNKDSGYEVVHNTHDHGYETVSEASRPPHSYETLKPRPPPPRTENQSSPTSTPPSPSSLEAETVPDILQDLTAMPEGIPPEIQALYARVDKSKKKSRRKPSIQKESEDRTSPPPPPHSPVSHVSSISSSTSSSPSTKDTFPAERGSEGVSGHPSATKDLIRKFNRLNSDEETAQSQPRSRQGSVASDTGSLRPLPPLPGSPPPLTPC